MFRHGDHTHAEVDVARLCELGLTFICTWLVRGLPAPPPDMDDDAADAYAEAMAEHSGIIECGATAWTNDRGWACEAGHEHVLAEVRHDEGWEYAEDGIEAGRLARAGVASVAMDGGYIEPVFA